MTHQFPVAHFAEAIFPEAIVPEAIVAAPVPVPHGDQYGRVFDLPPALHGMMIGAFLAYLGIMGTAFMTGEMILPIAICFITIIACFLTPGLWAKVAPPPAGRRQDWDSFLREGFICMTGHVSGRAAAIQVLILPVLILLWGVGIAIIAASVR